MKEFLSREGYAFIEKNVEEDFDALSELMATGWRSVPVTMIDGRVVTGYDVAELREALQAAGGPTPDR